VNVSSLGISLPSRYRLDGPVAAGGMAAVYAAHDTLLDRPVAVKVLAEHLNEDEAGRARFQREARAAAGLSSHPGVVTIFDVGEHDGRSFMVMELLTGGTLADVLRSGVRPEPEMALRWLHRAAGALDAAHERGIVHRDIKPANLLLDDQGELAVADFGIARLAWEDGHTATGQVLGTASYISPEQAVGDTATAASDRYALACVAYELLTGTRPFDGEHFAAQARAHIEDEPTPATVRDPNLPPAVDAVLARGLAKDPAARWPTAAAFVDALEGALSHEPTTVVMPARTVPAPAPAGRFTGPGGTRGPAPRERRGFPLVALAGVLLAFALVAIVLAASGGDDTSPTAKKTTTASKKKASTKKKAAATATPTAAATAAAPAASDESASSLNDKGYGLYRKGDYAGALPLFQQAVEKCGDSSELVCQYALFNLGSTLHRSGKPAEGIPYLQQRLERFPDNQPKVVAAELAAACDAAGQDCGQAVKGRGRDKARGKKKKD
jgi:serine/threonine-protein kinase